MTEEIVLKVSPREFHTILAALRFWADEECQCNPYERSPFMSALASNVGLVVPLSKAEVDALCERINLP